MTEPTFNPAYRVARCGQHAYHPPHVVEHGPDQPRNCPGTGGVVTEPNPTRADREAPSAPDGCLCGTCRPDLHEAYRRDATETEARRAAETETP